MMLKHYHMMLMYHHIWIFIYIRHPRRSILLRYIVHTLFAFVSIFFNKVFRVLSLLAKDMYGNLEKRGQWWFFICFKKETKCGLLNNSNTDFDRNDILYIVIIFLKLNDFVMILFDDKKKIRRSRCSTLCKLNSIAILYTIDTLSIKSTNHG